MKNEIDQYFYLVGDEDGGVGMMCRECDRRGLPIIQYEISPAYEPYKGTDVIVVHSVSDMFAPATKHIARHRAERLRA